MEQFQRSGLVFDVADSGPADGPVVVLLHGFPQDGGSWAEVAAKLNLAGYRTLAPGLRGCSPGARPGTVADYRYIESVRDVAALLDAAGSPQAHVVGHDWGGMVAWAVAATMPERVRTLTVLSTPHPRAMTAALTRSTQGLRSWYMGLFQVPRVAEFLIAPGQPLWSALIRGLPTGHADRYSARMADPQARTAALNWYRVLPLELRRPSIRWRKVERPTLYIWGTHDPALGRAAAIGTADWVGGQYTFAELPAGHWLPERHPQQVAALILEHLAQHS